MAPHLQKAAACRSRRKWSGLPGKGWQRRPLHASLAPFSRVTAATPPPLAGRSREVEGARCQASLLLHTAQSRRNERCKNELGDGSS